MNNNTKLACKEYEQMLLKASEYSGNKEPGKKTFSASMLGNEVLANYLKFMHGSQDSKVYGANTVGSLYQLGVDSAANLMSEKYSSAERFTYELSNGWTISGETDQFDKERKVIFDNKVTTATAIGKVRSEGKNHGYALQMGVYKFLMFKKYGEVYPAVLPMVDKSYSYFKANKNEQLEFVDIETHEPEEIEQLLLDATNELQQYIDLEQPPSQCKDLWFFGRKGQVKKKMRCIHYCDQKVNCPYYTDYNAVNDLLDL